MNIVTRIFGLPFYGVNFFRGIVQNTDLDFLKDVAYDFLKGSRYNWRKLLLQLSYMVTGYITSLTDDAREKVLIIDESIYDRSRSKGVELLARVYDCCAKRYLRGFRLLILVWSDTELLEPMVRRVLRSGIRVHYILMDSWFALSNIIRMLSANVSVICMLKNMYRVFYEYQGMKPSLDALYRRVKKRQGKATIKASVIVSMNTGQKVKIVFVRDRRAKGWLAILSTDSSLPDEEISESA